MSTQFQKSENWVPFHWSSCLDGLLKNANGYWDWSMATKVICSTTAHACVVDVLCGVVVYSICPMNSREIIDCSQTNSCWCLSNTVVLELWKRYFKSGGDEFGCICQKRWLSAVWDCIAEKAESPYKIALSVFYVNAQHIQKMIELEKLREQSVFLTTAFKAFSQSVKQKGY